MPADSTSAATEGNGDFGMSPIFVQVSDKHQLVSIFLRGASERKAQWRIGNYVLVLATASHGWAVTDWADFLSWMTQSGSLFPWSAR